MCTCNGLIEVSVPLAICADKKSHQFQIDCLFLLSSELCLHKAEKNCLWLPQIAVFKYIWDRIITQSTSCLSGMCPDTGVAAKSLRQGLRTRVPAETQFLKKMGWRGDPWWTSHRLFSHSSLIQGYPFVPHWSGP